MVVVAQLVRVAVCGAAGRRFEPGQPPRISKAPSFLGAFFVLADSWQLSAFSHEYTNDFAENYLIQIINHENRIRKAYQSILKINFVHSWQKTVK